MCFEELLVFRRMHSGEIVVHIVISDGGLSPRSIGRQNPGKKKREDIPVLPELLTKKSDQPVGLKILRCYRLDMILLVDRTCQIDRL